MKLTPESPVKLIIYSRPLLYATVIASSAFSLITSAFAAPAPVITNQATATYEDADVPADPKNLNDPNRINATSNVLTVAIQEVAGISVSQKGLTDDQGATMVAKGGDTIYFRFDVKNIGNDGTRFFIPNKATITGAGKVQKVQYFDEVAKIWQDVPELGFTSRNIAPLGILQTRVVVKVDDGAKDKIAVALGKTNETTANAQNQLQTTANTNPEDVYTVDNPDTEAGEIDGAPINGVREAMDTQEVTINGQLQAFATLKATAGNYVAADTSITYNLKFKVEDKAPSQASNVIPTDLVGTVVPGLGTKPGILISDAIPLGTKFTSVVVPNGWVAVYQYGTPIAATDRADTTTWSFDAPITTNTGTLIRVGFFLPESRITKGTEVTGFQIKVAVIDPIKTTQVYNIAQLFGNSPANARDPQDKTPNPSLPVVDESGDNNPNNFNTDGTPGVKDLQGKPFVSPGIVDPNTAATDPRNPKNIGQDSKGDNTGEGVGGEFGSTVVTATTILNGPKGQPEALGITGNNSDFTNKSTPVEPGIIKGSSLKFDPQAVGFFNTVQNGGDFTTDIKILPTVKADEQLPRGTKVTLKLVTTDAGVVFLADGAGNLTPADATKPVLVMPQVEPKASVDYMTIIDLPIGTAAVTGYPVVLTAFIDRNNDNLPGTDEPSNQTLDRVYTGFIDLVKESRILGANQQPLNEFTISSKVAQPGQYIEYRITFKNVSVAAPDFSGSKPLTANLFVITEDGNPGLKDTSNLNNWADLTINEPSSTKVSLGTVGYFTAPNSLVVQTLTTTDDLNVTKYVNTVGTLAPQKSGTFSFIRKVK